MAQAKDTAGGVIKLKKANEDVRVTCSSGGGACAATVTHAPVSLPVGQVKVKYKSEYKYFKSGAPVPDGWVPLDTISYYNNYGQSRLYTKLTVLSVGSFNSTAIQDDITEAWANAEKQRVPAGGDTQTRTAWAGNYTAIKDAARAEYSSSGIDQKIFEALKSNPAILLGTKEYARFHHQAIKWDYQSGTTFADGKKRFVRAESTMESTIVIEHIPSLAAFSRAAGSESQEIASKFQTTVESRPTLEGFVENAPNYSVEISKCGTWVLAGSEDTGIKLVSQNDFEFDNFMRAIEEDNLQRAILWDRLNRGADLARNDYLTRNLVRSIIENHMSGGGSSGGPYLKKSGNAFFLGAGGNIGDTYVGGAVRAPIWSADRTKYDIALSLGIIIGNTENGDPIVKRLEGIIESRYIPTMDTAVQAAIRNAPYLYEKIAQIFVRKDKNTGAKVTEAKAAVAQALATNAITPQQANALTNHITNQGATITTNHAGMTVGQQIGTVTVGTDATINPPSSNSDGTGAGASSPANTTNAPGVAQGGFIGVAQNTNVNAQIATFSELGNPHIGTLTTNSSTTVPGGSSLTIADKSPNELPASSASNITTNVLAINGQVGQGLVLSAPNPNYDGTNAAVIGGTQANGAKPEASTLTNVTAGFTAGQVIANAPKVQGTNSASAGGLDEKPPLPPTYVATAGGTSVMYQTNYLPGPSAPTTPTTAHNAVDNFSLGGVSELGGNRLLNGGNLNLGGGDVVINQNINGGSSGFNEVVVVVPGLNRNTLNGTNSSGSVTNIPNSTIILIFETEE